ncbi:MAG: flagellar biosynthesis protein FlgJ [Proteobacteria bacterium]|nr:flagellar biosynthesis protein FlgJ [Pseudomonadota bacterium]NBX86401.1 flagellar biosynthesis protein FlgJ [Pseudomonadota bacterium]
MVNILTPISANLGSTVPAEVKAKLQQKSQEFEAFYIYQFINLTMPKNESKVMNGGAGEEMFSHHLQEQLANNIAQTGGFGIAKQVYAELLRKQEQGQNTALPSQQTIPESALINTQTQLPK